MKITNNTNNKINRWRKGKHSTWDSTTRVTVGESDIGSSTREKKYICHRCSEPLNKISDDEWHCDTCLITTIPTIEDVRTDEDIEIPRGPADETLVSSIPSPGFGDVAVKKKLELKGAFKALADKGNIRFTSYTES